MAVVIDGRGRLYEPVDFGSETELEAVVVELADHIFGESTIYVDVKKRMSGNNIVTIPDGYVIDMTDPDFPKLFVIENETVTHDPFNHVGIQILRFVTSFEGAQREIRRFLMEGISKDEEKRSRLQAGCEASKSRNIDNYLDQAVYGDFRAVVVIDEARPELHHVLGKINANISVLELRRFESDSGQRLYQFDTLYDEYDEADHVRDKTSGKPSKEQHKARLARRARADTIIVPARKDGFEETFIGENSWYQISIGAAMKERIKYCAAYQVAPISAVTHIAEVQEIRPYKDTGKYIVIFKGPAEEIRHVKVKDVRYAPQSRIYVEREKLLDAESLDDALK